MLRTRLSPPRSIGNLMMSRTGKTRLRATCEIAAFSISHYVAAGSACWT
jgi:hypothetical protein